MLARRLAMQMSKRISFESSVWSARIVLICLAIASSTRFAAAAEAGKKFGTFFTKTGDVVELSYNGGTTLAGKLVKLGTSPRANPITIRGDNTKDGAIKLDFYQGNNFLKTIVYDRTGNVKKTPIGKQVYTDWKANLFDPTNGIISQYGLESLNSIVIGTGQPTNPQTSDQIIKTYVDFDAYSRAQRRLDTFFKKTSNESSKRSQNNFGGINNKYAEIRLTRPAAAYLAAVGIKQNIAPSDLHVRTLGANDAIAYIKQASLTKVALALSSDGNSAIADKFNTLPAPLLIRAIAIKIPNPNFIETYLTNFVLSKDDADRLSRVYKYMRVQFCDKEPPDEHVMLIYCDYFRDAFSSDGNPVWYRTAISIAATSLNTDTFTIASMFLKTVAANDVKSDYEKARRRFGSYTSDVTDAENYFLQSFIKALEHVYPKTHR